MVYQRCLAYLVNAPCVSMFFSDRLRPACRCLYLVVERDSAKSTAGVGHTPASVWGRRLIGTIIPQPAKLVPARRRWGDELVLP